MAAIAASPRSLARVHFALASRSLAVDVDDAFAAQILLATYGNARAHDCKTINHTASLRRLADGRLHVRFDRRGLAVGDAGHSIPLLSAYYATKEVFARFAAAHPCSIAFYGALVGIGNGAAALILGPTTIGKTVFALHLAARGATFLGDETAVLDLRSGTVCALARKPALRETALPYLPSDEMRARVAAAEHVIETDRGHFWYALGPEDICGIAPSDRPHQLRAVCIIRQRAESCAIRRVDFAHALPALMQRAYARPSQTDGSVAPAPRDAQSHAFRNYAGRAAHLGAGVVAGAAIRMRVIRAEQLTRCADGNGPLERHCVHTAACEIAGVAMELCTDIPEVARLFSLRYADHRADRPPDFRYYVATVRGGYAFWCAHAASWRWSQGALPPDAVAFLADAVALSALVRFDRRLASIQAACVEYGGVAAAIAGKSTTGKTTTLLACARRGMRVYSDERTVLRENVVHPFLRRSSIRAAGTRLLLADNDADRPPDALRAAPQLSLKTCFGSAAIAAPRRLRAMFVLNGAGRCAALEAIETAAALPAISRSFEACGDMVDRIARAMGTLQNVRCYRLTLGSPDESAAAIAYALTRIAAAS